MRIILFWDSPGNLNFAEFQVIGFGLLRIVAMTGNNILFVDIPPAGQVTPQLG